MKKHMGKFSVVIFVFSAVMLAFMPRIGIAAEDPSDDVSFKIHGRGKQFSVDRKKREIALGDCVVTDVHAHRTWWELPAEYKKQESMQRLFDEILAGEVVVLSMEQEAELREGMLDPYAYAGITIECESPKGRVLLQRKRCANLTQGASRGTIPSSS